MDNLLIGDQDAAGQSALFIVDWGNPIFAPKERDLMFVGMSRASAGAREETLFYQGYAGECGCGPFVKLTRYNATIGSISLSSY